MKIQSRNARTVDVPVNRDDIVSITFEDRPMAGGGTTWDFETGDLRGWTAAGNAFAYQPTFGDNPTARHRGQPSNHPGQYWIGGYEKRPRASDPPGQIQGDGPQSTLTSQHFTITRPYISFLIGGECDLNSERVELLIDGRAVLQATGKCTETMERMKWNANQFMGRSAQIRLVDASSGGWGHINFDDVRFEWQKFIWRISKSGTSALLLLC